MLYITYLKQVDHQKEGHADDVNGDVGDVTDVIDCVFTFVLRTIITT